MLLLNLKSNDVTLRYDSNLKIKKIGKPRGTENIYLTNNNNSKDLLLKIYFFRPLLSSQIPSIKRAARFHCPSTNPFNSTEHLRN